MPTGAVARSASTDSPCESSRWCDDAQGGRPVADPRRLHALGVAEERDHPRLVVRDPAVDHVAQLGRHQRRVLGEALGGVAHGPAAGRLARLRQVPVVERRDRLDAALAQAFAQPPVPVDPRAVQGAAPLGLHPRPGDREAVGLGAERRHQVQVLAPAVVVVAGDVARVAARDRPRTAAERVPDRRAAPVLAHGALDLVRRHRDAEPEAGRERADRRRLERGRRHPFTAPAVRPFTSQRCVRKKAMRTGRVETTPAAMSCAVLCW